MGDKQLEFLDVLSILSFYVGYENLIENRQQSVANDVSSANNKQAQALLAALGEQFEKQNEMLREILEAVRK